MMVSKMLGIPGCLFVLDFLAAIKRIENARRSTVPRRGECQVRGIEHSWLGSEDIPKEIAILI